MKALFRFKLSSLLAVFTLFAISFIGLRHWLDGRPILWTAYSTQAFDLQAGNSSPMIVFVGADYDAGSVFVKKFTFNERKLTKVIRERSVVAFYADLTSFSPDVQSLLRRVDRNSTPTVVV